jgi:tRNA dimethylallyltransferase
VMGLQPRQKLVVLIGPTAVGKTTLSMEIAKKFHGEIISGDSMQIYRGMDIGTAKASKEEQALVSHHLIDIVNPDEAFSVAMFQEKASQLISEIQAREHLPIIVGGTGLYIESLCYGFQFSEGGSDEAFRSRQMEFLQQHGEQALHDKLNAIDPITAERLHRNDYRRVIRALEINHVTGKPMSEHLSGQKKESPYELCLVGLTMDRALLYKRIEARIDEMLEQGLIAEIHSLLAQGYTKDLVSMQGLGYKEIVGYLEGQYDETDAIILLKKNTRHYAKRQLSWFRHMKEIEWVDVSDTGNFSAHYKKISDIIAGKFVFDQEYKYNSSTRLS